MKRLRIGSALLALVIGGVLVGCIPPPPPPLSTMPTHANTGPDQALTGPDISGATFAANGHCDHQRVVGDVNVQDWSGNGLPGKVWSANQCEFTGQVFIELDGFYPVANYPTLNLTKSSVANGLLLLAGIKGNIVGSDIGGAGFFTPCANCAGTYWDVRRPMPLHISDTLFWEIPPNPYTDGIHREALHLMGSSTGMTFDNVRFSINGPYNGSQTGAVLLDADQMTLNNVFFDFNGTSPASYYTAYIGRGGDTSPGAVTITGCRIEKGLSWYIYPNGTANHNSVGAQWSGCTDWSAGQTLTLGP